MLTLMLAAGNNVIRCVQEDEKENLHIWDKTTLKRSAFGNWPLTNGYSDKTGLRGQGLN